MRFLLILFAAASLWAQDGKVHQPVKYKHVYLEEDPKSRIALEFYIKTNCPKDSVRVEDFQQVRTLADDETGRPKDIRIFNVYATLLPDADTCEGEKKEKLAGTFKVPSDARHKTRLYVTLEGWLVLKVVRY